MSSVESENYGSGYIRIEGGEHRRSSASGMSTSEEGDDGLSIDHLLLRGHQLCRDRQLSCEMIPFRWCLDIGEEMDEVIDSASLSGRKSMTRVLTSVATVHDSLSRESLVHLYSLEKDLAR